MLSSDRTAALVGAGVAGLATACGLASAGWETRVLERRPDLSEGGRAILLQPNGLAALAQLGTLERVLERGLPLSKVNFYGPRRKLAAYDYAELRHPHPYCVEIRPADLRQALTDRLAELGGNAPELGCEVVGLRGAPEAVTGVRYRDARGRDRELASTCIVGTDGPASTVRTALGVACRHFSARDTYVLGTVSIDSGLEEVAVHCGRGYADGVVPLRDGTYFWDRVTNENQAAVESRDLAGWRAVYEQRLPPDSAIPTAVDSWDQLTIVNVRPFWARSRVFTGVALAGDAAGAVHPHSAQGANLALEDAVALAHSLAGYPSSKPVARAALEPYARARHRTLQRYVLWSLLAAGSLDARTPIWRGVRASGFGWNRVGPVRRALLKRQAGLG
jgi:2-polyprenyl-6-methoxyphenol hydroxylase-like FAD-dependent oxidoreductase